MALEGTLRDFSLADIFQLIGLQRKTGVLTLAGPQDTISIPFEKGRIVGADSEQKHLEDRLGHVLLKTGKIRQEQLNKVLRLQRETGRRIGDLLVEEAALTAEDLSRALELQVTQILYRVFRWSEGEFRFAQAASVEYDRKRFRPIPVENILMEGLRILDEWPLIERRVRSFSLVYAPTDPSRVVRETADGAGVEDTPGLEEAFADPSGPSGGAEQPLPSEEAPDLVTVSASELVVYRLLDGQRGVQDIIDRSDLGEFETCKALYELLEKELIHEVVPSRERKAATHHGRIRAAADRALATLVAVGASAAILAGAWLGTQQPGASLLSPYPVEPVASSLRVASSQSRLARLEFAVRLFGLYRGRYPESLRDLATMGLVTEDELRDPWGKAYTYLVSRRSYQLLGLDGAGHARPDLILTGQIPPAARPDTGSAEGPRLSRR